VFGVVELCEAASRHNRAANYDYQYGNQYDSHPDYSYSQEDTYDVPVEEMKCYSCEYRVWASENHHEGAKECMEPFSGEGVVPEVECASRTCSVS